MLYISEGTPCKVLTNVTVSPNGIMIAIEFQQMKWKCFFWVSANLQSKVIQNFLKKSLERPVIT